MGSGEFAQGLIGPIVIRPPRLQVIGVADVEFTSLVLEDADPLHDPGEGIGSRGRARTCNPPVNSRLLYH